MNSIDSRQFPRIETNAYVDCTGEKTVLFHMLDNISLGGISIKAPTVEKVGSTVELVINFPDDEFFLKTLGEVVWSREDEIGRMGIKFLNLSDEQKKHLRRFLAKTDPFYID